MELRANDTFTGGKLVPDAQEASDGAPSETRVAETRGGAAPASNRPASATGQHFSFTIDSYNDQRIPGPARSPAAGHSPPKSSRPKPSGIVVGGASSEPGTDTTDSPVFEIGDPHPSPKLKKFVRAVEAGQVGVETSGPSGL